jgi:hypothetical protein
VAVIKNWKEEKKKRRKEEKKKRRKEDGYLISIISHS